MDLSLAVPAFIAGMFTFLAPCTLPFVPAYLGFISGVSNEEMRDPKRLRHVRGKVVLNGFLYVTGFTAVFVLMGTVFGVGGIALAAYRVWLARIAGVFVILFGLYLMHAFKLPFLRFLSDEKRFNFGRTLKPGKPLSALIFDRHSRSGGRHVSDRYSDPSFCSRHPDRPCGAAHSSSSCSRWVLGCRSWSSRSVSAMRHPRSGGYHDT